MGAAAALMAGGGLLSAGSSLMQGELAQISGEMNAEQAEENARLALEKAAGDERKFRMQVRQMKGSNVAAISASGIALTGSALDVLAANASNSEMDALAIRKGGATTHAALLKQAAISRFEGKQGKQAGRIGAAASLLGSAGSALKTTGSSPQGAKFFGGQS